MKKFRLYLPVLTLLCFLFAITGCSTMAEQPPVSYKDQLLQGNKRFASMNPSHPRENKQRLNEIAAEQHPFAAVICCSDSRVPPELVFDQGLGDLFVVRTAGNLMGGLELGSIEYAVEHLGVKLVVVMGHQQCGAFKAFVNGADVPGHIQDIVDSIKGEAEIREIPANDDHLLEDCILANIRHGIKQLRLQSALIDEKLQKGELEIAGAIYQLREGKVNWIYE